MKYFCSIPLNPSFFLPKTIYEGHISLNFSNLHNNNVSYQLPPSSSWSSSSSSLSLLFRVLKWSCGKAYLLLFHSTGLKHGWNFFFTNNILEAMFKYVKSELVLLSDIGLNINATDDSKTVEIMISLQSQC